MLLTLALMLAEVAGGLWSGSLALLSDAGHMLTDLLALMVAFGAVTLSTLPADNKRTYGYRRLEIIGAMINGVFLLGLSGTIIYEAVQRWIEPREVHSGVMAAVAAVGLGANLVGLWLLGGHGGNLNLRGAFLHVLGDALTSVGVLLGALVIYLTGWTRIDALVSVLIALVVAFTSLALLREVLEVLIEAAPRGINAEEVRETIGGVQGVDGVHDLHVWSITSGMPALSAHIVVSDPGCDPHSVRIAVQTQLHERYAIDHATLQVEAVADENCGCC